VSVAADIRRRNHRPDAPSCEHDSSSKRELGLHWNVRTSRVEKPMSYPNPAELRERLQVILERR